MPLVKPTQFEKSFNNYNNMSFEFLVAAAPFLEEEVIDDIVLKGLSLEDNNEFIALAPFMSDIALYAKWIEK